MPSHRTVPPALRPIVLVAGMRDLLPPARLADLLATLTPPVDPTGPEWADLCSALDAYDHATRLGLNTDEARHQVDTAAMILHRQGCRPDPPPPTAPADKCPPTTTPTFACVRHAARAVRHQPSAPRRRRP